MRTAARKRVAIGTVVVVGAVLTLAGLAVTSRGEAAATDPPVNVVPPVISGMPFVGNSLDTSTGTWTGTPPLGFVYQWQRCDAFGANCVAVAGWTYSNYSVEREDERSTLRVQVTATNSAGSASSTSVPTAIVKGVQTVTGCPPIQEAGPLGTDEVTPPERLLIDRTSISPAVVRRSTEVVRIRFHVVACEGREIKGALVEAVAVPYQQFHGAETATDGNGWATITLRQLRFFPVSGRQQLLVIFVRARKPGENLLGGISSRRLFSFPVKAAG